MDRLYDLAIAYPDFQLNQIIDPDQIDLNNSQMVSKINQLVGCINTLTQGTTGGSQITIAVLPEFPSAKNVQTALSQIATYCKANNTSITQILQKDAAQDGEITSLKQRVASEEGKSTTQEGEIASAKQRLTNSENKNNEQDNRLIVLEQKDQTDELRVDAIDVRVTKNTNDITAINEELDGIRNINTSAEVTEARKSFAMGQTYVRLGNRLDASENKLFSTCVIGLNEDISVSQRVKGKMYFRVKG